MDIFKHTAKKDKKIKRTDQILPNVYGTTLKQVNVLRNLKFTLSKQALSNIYLTFIRPVLEYACEVWDGCYERDIKYN